MESIEYSLSPRDYGKGCANGAMSYYFSLKGLGVHQKLTITVPNRFPAIGGVSNQSRRERAMQRSRIKEGFLERAWELSFNEPRLGSISAVKALSAFSSRCGNTVGLARLVWGVTWCHGVMVCCFESQGSNCAGVGRSCGN